MSRLSTMGIVSVLSTMGEDSRRLVRQLTALSDAIDLSVAEAVSAGWRDRDARRVFDAVKRRTRGERWAERVLVEGRKGLGLAPFSAAFEAV